MDELLKGKFMIVNMDTSIQMTSPVMTGTNIGITNTISNPYYYGISSVVQSINNVPVASGLTSIGTILSFGTFGTSIQLKWTPDINAYKYIIYKGTSDETLKEWVNIGGTIGTWIDTNVNNIPLSTKETPSIYNTAFTQSIIFPDLRSYVPKYDTNLIIHNMSNFSKVVYNKGNIWGCTIGFEQLNETELSDVRLVYNWRNNLRFYPSKDTKPNIYFDCILNSGWNFGLTIPTLTTGGWNGEITLVGNKAVNSISEVL